MTTIFIKSYQKDFKLLYYSLLSIQKFVKGDYNTVLMIDTGNVLPDRIKDILPSINCEVVSVNPVINGYLFQQYCKLAAHKYTKADYIFYSDSDCLFDKPIDLDEYLKDGKPEILYTHYDKVGDAICWKSCTDKFIGYPQEYEFMRRLPLVYHRDTIERVYNYVPDILNYIVTGERFSEFNAIGAWAFREQDHRYKFVNTDNWQYVEPIAVQLWSHAEKDGDKLQKVEYTRTVETINKIFGLNINDL